MDNVRYKTIVPRFGAWIIDTSVFLLLYLLIETTTSYCDNYIALASTPIWLCYSIFFHGKFGQTPGKMVTKVKVVNVVNENKTLGFYKAALRDVGWTFLFVLELIFDPGRTHENIGMIFTLLTCIWMIAEIVALFSNAKQRAIHDFIASSVVINIKHSPDL